ncbi:MAG TPA: glycosyltransferase family 39 protein [Vicinamibacteria bacterium]|nr:glycosyltransferase family 39 protein [Vicinamibacteria bacterium]
MSAVFMLGLATLVAVGCLRPVLGEGIRESWHGLVLLLGLGCSVLGVVRARARGAGHEGILLSFLPLALAAGYLQPQRVASDGIFYFAPLHSVVVDLDLDFENEYRVLGAEPGYFQRTATGRLPNNFSIGPALLWAPFYLLAHGLGHLGLYRPTGFGYPYFTAVATGTVLIGFVGVVALFRLARCYFEPSIAFASVLFCWLATFHVWYMVFEPSMSHALAITSVSLFFLSTHRGVEGLRGYALMGALGGLVALIRWQNVILLPVALGVSLSRRRFSPREWLVGGAVFLLVSLPQLVYWKVLYGSFFLVPQGRTYLDWASPEIEAVLFSSRHGLLSWAPILWTAVAGLPAFVRRAPAFGWGIVASALGVLVVNASVFDWWAGASFGSRRFDGVVPAFVLGLAAVIEWLLPLVAARPLVALGAMLAPFVVWNGMLMGVYFRGAVPSDGPVSFRQAAADGIELWYRHTGYPFSWPGALVDRVRLGRPLSVYDLFGSQSLANNVDVRMGETDDLYLGRGWSPPIRERGRTVRDVAADGGEVFVALREPAPYVLELEGEPGGRARVLWDAEPIETVALDDQGDASLVVPPRRVRSGANTITLVPLGAARLRIGRILLTRPGTFE